MTVTQFDPGTDAPTDAQKAAEANALEQGEKIAAMEAEDKAKKMEDVSSQNEEASLIDGKFKSQDDLLKAYKELQTKLGKGEKTEEEGEDEEEEAPKVEAEVEEVIAPTVKLMEDLGAQYAKGEELSVDNLESLEKMDSKELIKAYMEYNDRNSAKLADQRIKSEEVAAIQQSVGGSEAYGEMIQWAAGNLSEQEISDFNTVTNSGNTTAIKFAVENLSTKFKAKEGYEAPLVTGKGSKSGKGKVYRSQAELARDIANPLYNSDPAFRQDVEQKLMRSSDLL